MDFSKPPYDLPRILFSITFIVLMTIGCFYIIQPFIISFLWALILVITTWPLFIKLQYILRGQRFFALIIIAPLLLLLFIVPISILINSITDNITPLITWATQPGKIKFPVLTWLQNIPIIGQKLYNIWQLLISNDNLPFMTNIQPYIGKFASWILNQVANLGNLLLQCGLIIIFSIILYLHGETIEITVKHFAIRLAPERGKASILLAVQAIRAVALGIILTSIVQSVLGSIGLIISGIPLSPLLTIIMFLLCIAQLGPLLVLIPAIIWLYWSDNTTYGTILLLWSCFIIILDNILRPILIHVKVNLPILLVLCGILGGLLAFGMIGLFIGPVILAISRQLILTWIQEIPLLRKTII